LEMIYRVQKSTLPLQMLFDKLPNPDV